MVGDMLVLYVYGTNNESIIGRNRHGVKIIGDVPIFVAYQSADVWSHQELFELDYGRMNATLGVELPFTSALTQTTIPLAYIDPATETVSDGETQFWKITHNGVDTHPVHFHLVNVQIVNRVGWDGTIKPPYANELGWKDTIKISPLMDTIVAVRPRAPLLPFGLQPVQQTGYLADGGPHGRQHVALEGLLVRQRAGIQVECLTVNKVACECGLALIAAIRVAPQPALEFERKGCPRIEPVADARKQGVR